MFQFVMYCDNFYAGALLIHNKTHNYVDGKLHTTGKKVDKRTIAPKKWQWTRERQREREGRRERIKLEFIYSQAISSAKPFY